MSGKETELTRRLYVCTEKKTAERGGRSDAARNHADLPEIISSENNASFATPVQYSCTSVCACMYIA